MIVSSEDRKTQRQRRLEQKRKHNREKDRRWK
jgi:hypothetical protein